jgi:hypothetical protein
MLIVGTRPNTKLLGQIAYICPSCQHNSWHSVGRTRRWFTLFFVPVIPFTKSSVSRCNLCGFMQRVPNPQAEQWFKTGQMPTGLIPQLQPGYVPPPAIAAPQPSPQAARQTLPGHPHYPQQRYQQEYPQQPVRHTAPPAYTTPQTYYAGPPPQQGQPQRRPR